jgi:hemerythrin-like domain-containing protein
MDILDVIKKEHRQAASMLDQADRCDPGDPKLFDLAKQLEYALSTHVQIEERLFYSRLRKDAKDEGEIVDVYEAYTEHDVAAHLIDLLKAGRKPNEKFKAELQVLGESVKHHIKEEESTVFAIARSLINANERDELGDKWAKARQRLDATNKSELKPHKPKTKTKVRTKTSSR